MPAPVCLIVNPAAGGGRAARVAPRAERALRAHGLQVRREDTRDLEHARELAADAAARGETIVTLGGDGLIGAIADRLRTLDGAPPSGAPSLREDMQAGELERPLLGVIPGGRGNDLARVLGIPDDPEAAAAIIAAGHARALDLGYVEEQPPASGPPAGRAFVGIASAGFDSDANRIANQAPPWLGQLVYVYGALRALLAWRPARFQIELDPPGERRVYTGFSVGAANSRAYGGGMWAAPDALLDDGLLELVLVQEMSKLAFLTRILPKVFKGTHVHEPEVRVFRAREIVLEADRPFTMYADGDPIGRLPVRVRALPGAIRMLTPSAPNGAFAQS